VSVVQRERIELESAKSEEPFVAYRANAAAANRFPSRNGAARLAGIRVAVVVILSAAAVGAEVPGGHVYVGGGAALSAARGAGESAALFLELNFEQPRSLFTLRLTEGNARADTGLIYLLASLSAHYILLDSSWAPYLGAGVAWQQQWVNTKLDCADAGTGCFTGDYSGPALSAEAGFLFLRDLRFGRAAVFGQLVKPLFSVHNSGNPPGSDGASLLFLAGARVSF